MNYEFTARVKNDEFQSGAIVIWDRWLNNFQFFVLEFEFKNLRTFQGKLNPFSLVLELKMLIF